MNKHGIGRSLAATYHIYRAIVIQINKHRIFRRCHVTNRYMGPGSINLRGPRMDIHAHEAAFFPWRDKIRQTICVDIVQADPIGTLRAIINRVPHPRFTSRRIACHQQQDQQRFKYHRAVLFTGPVKAVSLGQGSIASQLPNNKHSSSSITAE